MKTDGQVRHKLKQVLYRHLKLRLENNFKKRPETCKHNGTILYGTDGPLTAPKFCAHASQLGLVCDVAHGGLEKARSCPHWTPNQTKEEVKQEFYGLLTEPKHVLASEMPDAVALMWVLDEEEISDFPAESEEPLIQIEEPRVQAVEASPLDERLIPLDPAAEPNVDVPGESLSEEHDVVVQGDLIVMGDIKVMGQYLTPDRVSNFWLWPGWQSRWWPWNWLP